ncbi:glycine betaine ABC transporter substrate-binding protein, partial [Rhizobium johnstonii]|uniref:glycine betaine ABC transporter substrate-binding protein n=1 Tax=Rhizobium johnstonii TaxID=3019933 RepID=UPI003F973C7A
DDVAEQRAFRVDLRRNDDVGNVIALALEANGIKTQERIALGATPVVRKAITAGEIDIYHEYNGNAGFFFNKADDAAWKNIDQ